MIALLRKYIVLAITILFISTIFNPTIQCSNINTNYSSEKNIQISNTIITQKNGLG